MEEGSFSDRSDLSVAEETTDWYVPEVFVEDTGIEVGLSVEAFTASETGEHKGACDTRNAGPFGTFGAAWRRFVIAGKHDAKVFGGGLGVTEMEAEAHAFLEVLADGDGPPLGIHPDEVPDQELPDLGLLVKLVHQNPDEQGRLGEAPITLVEYGEEILDHLYGRPSV